MKTLKYMVEKIWPTVVYPERTPTLNKVINHLSQVNEDQLGKREQSAKVRGGSQPTLEGRRVSGHKARDAPRREAKVFETRITHLFFYCNVDLTHTWFYVLGIFPYELISLHFVVSMLLILCLF